MYRSNTYNVLASYRQNSPQLPKTCQPRLKSLQKIKVSRKGLPNDFFRPSVQIPVQPIKLRINTEPNEFQDINKTPTFIDSQIIMPQPRQYKSEERIRDSTSQKDKNPVRNPPQQVTFAKFFPKGDRSKRPKQIETYSRISGKDKEVEKKGEQSGCMHKQELGDLMRRKHLDREKYPYLLYPKMQSKGVSYLPILKNRMLTDSL